MPKISIVSASALFSASLALLILAEAEAQAQTATDAAPGKPIPLLRILTQPDNSKTKPRVKSASKRIGRTHIAAVRKKLARFTARVISPATNRAAPATAAAFVPALQVTPAAADADPRELIIAGQTIRLVTPNDMNEIDLAAGDADTAAAAASAASADTVAASSAAASPSDMATIEPPSESADSATAQHSQIGAASWIAQVLAALGGAIAAGALAWFLIGSTPQRTYG